MDIFGRFNKTTSAPIPTVKNTDHVENVEAKGDINMNNIKISNLKPPDYDSDASDKNYVDSQITKFTHGDFPMVGELNMDGKRTTIVRNPGEGTDAATKDYVDTKDIGFIRRSHTGVGEYDHDLNQTNVNCYAVFKADSFATSATGLFSNDEGSSRFLGFRRGNI